MQKMELRPGLTSSFAGLAAEDRGSSDDRPSLVLLHGLTFDRTMWLPALAELDEIDPGRRVIALDLPGHGQSPEAPSYAFEAMVERVHAAILEADLVDPVIVGHSAAAGIASLYAAQHGTRGVVAVEGVLRIDDFAAMAQSLEPVLRGPGFDATWERISANMFRLDEVAPGIREAVNSMARPRQEIILGYWQDLFERTPVELDAWIARAIVSIRDSGISYVGLFGQAPSPVDQAWLEARFPEARTLVWPGSGHFPQLAHPRQFAELLAETGSWVHGGVAAPVRG